MSNLLVLAPQFFFATGNRPLHTDAMYFREEITIDSIGCVRKSVLGERADLFEFANDTIELTEAAQMMNPTDGLPVPWRVGELGSWGRGLGLRSWGCFFFGLVAWL